jgi:hypothetical protein
MARVSYKSQSTNLDTDMHPPEASDPSAAPPESSDISEGEEWVRWEGENLQVP